eukprot:GGOE01000310.1.p1 GENE.GGOE01000310.1~~GGOE01000310.1.p1  ORF type:complete len:782 (+),score=172.88 GGOE01000310.1:80-2347(+)
MAAKHAYYRAADTVSDVFKHLHPTRRKDHSDNMRDLRHLINPNFYNKLMQTPFSEMDVENKGLFTMDDFSRCFGMVAAPQELLVVFRLLDNNNSGKVTYGEYQSFHKQHDPQFKAGRRLGHRKLGSPDYLEYATLLEGIIMSCSRFALAEKMQLAGETYPPREEWLLSAMQAEWSNPKLLLHWWYVTHPVPESEEGRRFPDWNGGFSVRDTGHVGMSIGDFCGTEAAAEAGLTVAEVVGLRLYTGPGYEALNLSLRANSQRFPVTQFCIDSAIGKMGRVAPVQVLLRGMKKVMDPRWVRLYNVYRGVGHRHLALSDPGFVSTTTDAKVATGKDFGGPVLFLLKSLAPRQKGQFGFLSNGGDVQWVSQYPSEAEILLPSNVMLIPELLCRHMRGYVHPHAPDKKQFRFMVFYPWDFEYNCPLVTDDFLQCANALVDLIHLLDVALVKDCKAGHPPCPEPEPEPEPAASSSPPTQQTTSTSKENQTAHSMLIPEYPVQCDHVVPHPYIDTDPHYSKSLHLWPSPFISPSRSMSPDEFPHPYTFDAPPTLHHLNPTPAPTAFPSAGTWISAGGPWTAQPYPTAPVYPGRAVYAAPPVVLSGPGGSNALRLAKVKYYRQKDLDKALEAYRKRPRYDDGLDEHDLTGNDFPTLAAVLCPFEKSAWNVGLWGLILATIGAGLSHLGIGGGGAAGIAAAVVVTTVVATAVPITVMQAQDRAAKVSTLTPTVTLTMTRTPTRTATPTCTRSIVNATRGGRVVV